MKTGMIHALSSLYYGLILWFFSMHPYAQLFRLSHVSRASHTYTNYNHPTINVVKHEYFKYPRILRAGERGGLHR